MFDFSGKYAVVTGGAKGIGRATVRQLINDHAAGVAMVDIEDATHLAEEIDPSGSRVFPICCDVTDREAVAHAFRDIFDRFKRVDFMINSAGICINAEFHEMDDLAWDRQLEVNLQGVYNCTKQVINPMRDQEFGRIIFISSIGIYGTPKQCGYSASKGALYTLTKNLARGQIGKHVTVNCIIPGPIDTDMLRSFSTLSSDPVAVKEKRIGQPEDVASLACYLCTDAAYFINGSRIDINGGIQ